MLPYLLIAGLLAVAALYGLRALRKANPATLVRQVKLGAGIAAGAVTLFLLSRGSFSSAIGMAGLAVWLLADAGFRPWPGQGGTRSGNVSRVKTDHLEMELDHASGRMSGVILKGFFKGRRIERLRPVELAHLWQDCRFVDPQSAQLVEAYLDKVHPTWREDLARAEAQAPRGADGRMSRGEALDILGLKEGASGEDIRKAHRELMLRMHPDRGGSTYLAAKINEAKEVALGES